MITSTKNEKVKEIRSLQGRAKNRKEAGLFVIEGVRLLEEALRAGWQPKTLLYADDLNQRGMALVSKIQEVGAQAELAAPHVLESISDTKKAQGVVAVFSMQKNPLPDKLDFVLVLDQIRDPGNLGTLLRTASAAGVQAVFLLNGTVDVFSPKVLRSAMGAQFQIPILQGDAVELKTLCDKQGLQILATDVRGGENYNQINLKTPVALVIGGEANGIGEDIQALAPNKIHIPMPGKSESLNAAIAGAVFMFEVVRQRGS